MGRFAVRQPNGQLCVFTTICDEPIACDCTEEDAIQLIADLYAGLPSCQNRDIVGEVRRNFRVYGMDSMDISQHLRRPYGELPLDGWVEFLNHIGYEYTQEDKSNLLMHYNKARREDPEFAVKLRQRLLDAKILMIEQAFAPKEIVNG